MIDVRCFTVGPLAENCFLVRRAGATQALLVDPGEEAERLQQVIAQLGVTIEAILLTHTHFDHVGAVAPLARHTGAPVYCPKSEVPILADINRWTFPGFGPYESYDADETIEGGETLELAGLTLDVIFTPGHSPGHVSFSIAEAQVVLSGDVLFQGSIGRTDLPGGDMATLMASIDTLLEKLPDETRVLPGHGPMTTLGRERASNPFLRANAYR